MHIFEVVAFGAGVVFASRFLTSEAIARYKGKPPVFVTTPGRGTHPVERVAAPVDEYRWQELEDHHVPRPGEDGEAQSIGPAAGRICVALLAACAAIVVVQLAMGWL